MKKQFFFLFLITVTNIFSQEQLADNNFKKMYLFGGIVSVITQKDLDFATKYQVKYIDLGCNRPVNTDFYEKENKATFEYLKSKFGITWQKDIHSLAIGLSKWKNTTSK